MFAKFLALFDTMRLRSVEPRIRKPYPHWRRKPYPHSPLFALRFHHRSHKNENGFVPIVLVRSVLGRRLISGFGLT